MITTPHYPQYTLQPTTLPVDKLVIHTHIQLKAEIGKCLPNELDNLAPEIRPLIHSIVASASAEKLVSFASKENTHKYNPTIAARTVYVDSFSGIKLHASEDPSDGWVIHTIVFNPGSVFNGHNGRVPNEEEFLHAASALIELVTPLLRNPNEWIHILPGLHDRSRAWWKSIEIPFHVLDGDHAILSAFAGAKHPEINKRPVYTCQGESICFQNSDRDLLIRIYRKDLEMRQKLRSKLTNNQPVLRIEVQLQKEKLKQHLRHGTWKLIGGKERLVGFRAHDLRAAHFAVMSKFDGAYSRIPVAKGDVDHKMGRLMGWISSVTGLSVEHLLEYYSARFLVGKQPDSIRNAKSGLRIAARKELTLLSPVNLTALFSEEAWNNQPVVAASKVETMTRARHRDVRILPEVEAAYGSRVVITA